MVYAGVALISDWWRVQLSRYDQTDYTIPALPVTTTSHAGGAAFLLRRRFYCGRASNSLAGQKELQQPGRTLPLKWIGPGLAKAGQLSGAGSKLTRIAEQAKITPSQLALAWLLRRSPVMLPIPGTSQVAHLEENVATAAVKIDDSTFQELNKLAGEGR
jgi:Aldo/keto reductase family